MKRLKRRVPKRKTSPSPKPTQSTYITRIGGDYEDILSTCLLMNIPCAPIKGDDGEWRRDEESIIAHVVAFVIVTFQQNFVALFSEKGYELAGRLSSALDDLMAAREVYATAHPEIEEYALDLYDYVEIVVERATTRSVYIEHCDDCNQIMDIEKHFLADDAMLDAIIAILRVGCAVDHHTDQDIAAALDTVLSTYPAIEKYVSPFPRPSQLQAA